MRPLVTATARAVHEVALQLPSGEGRRVVLRRFVPTAEAVLDPDMDAARELAVLRLLEGIDVHAPQVLAADATAAHADVPAIVQQRLPGSPPRGVPDLQSLLAALADVHALAPAARTAGIPGHRRWNDPAATHAPGWAGDPALWRAAIDIARAPAPASEPAFIHGDFHLGNTLWRRGRLTGIVHWTTGAIGPPAADLAQLRWNLAVAEGAEAAEFALPAADAAGVVHDPYWDVANVVDLLPDIAPSRPPPPTALARLEAFLRSAVAAALGAKR
ncbi:MAG: phosphotransferase [Chloroflexota bacterium]|nr:phosphotransferase [Chloroflexota bacterium]